MIDISVILFENDKYTQIIKISLGKGDKYEIEIGIFKMFGHLSHNYQKVI